MICTTDKFALFRDIVEIYSLPLLTALLSDPSQEVNNGTVPARHQAEKIDMKKDEIVERGKRGSGMS